ncbi:hypothetical protein MMC26_005591 [Xylographa opegraphella]|nr:hypothetical protein [Xylographa opegraphella]
MLFFLQLIRLAILFSFGNRVHAVLILNPATGQDVRCLDCVEALKQLWLQRASTVQVAYQVEHFSIFNPFATARLPQKFRSRSCAIGVYMTAPVTQPVATTSWFNIFLAVEHIILRCLQTRRQGCSGLVRNAGLDIVVGDPTVAEIMN